MGSTAPSNNALKLTSLTRHDGFGLQLNAVLAEVQHGRRSAGRSRIRNA
jgi:hypothetical protein